MDDERTAPDEERHEARKAPDVQREYRNDQIVVSWEPKRCIHVANCIRGLPHVFRPNDRPWVHVDAATADEIARVVMTCPTGALHFKRLDGGPQEPEPDQTTIAVQQNGPLFVRGKLRIERADGRPIREETRAALCRCGQSENTPFCDGSHRRVGFHAP